MITDEKAEVIFKAVQAVQGFLMSGKAVAIAVLGTPAEPEAEVVVGHDYWKRYPATGTHFEQIASKNPTFTRGVLAVPLIVAETNPPGFRGPPALDLKNPAPVEGEHEEIFVLSVDLSEGLDVLRCIYTRRPNGEPVFGDVEYWLDSELQLEDCPGRELIRLLATHPTEGIQ